MKKYLLYVILGGMVVAGTTAAIVGVLVNRNVSAEGKVFFEEDNVNSAEDKVFSEENEVLTADDVGITALMNEKIVSASFDSHIPTYIYECKNLEEISPLLDTLKDAEFRRVGSGSQDISSLEMVHIKTESGNSYSVGFAYDMVGSGGFAVTINGERSYYECSTQNDFQRKLMEIEGRKVNSFSEENEVLTADDVGITALMNEKIVSASFDSLNPEYIFECKNLEEIPSLLDTLKDAEFRRVSPPSQDDICVELVCINTERNNSYSVGIVYDMVGSGGFAVTINGERSYYKCSTQIDFQRKLMEIEGRKVNSFSEENEVLTADDVGITALMNENIVSARFSSNFIPTYIYEFTSLEEIPPLLDTLKDAEFRRVGPPLDAILSLELVHIKTESGNSYSVGYIYDMVNNGGFAVMINGECSYYKCSTQNDFQRKLMEIEGRKCF